MIVLEVINIVFASIGLLLLLIVIYRDIRDELRKK